MFIKGLVEEDFIQYKKPSMVLLMPHCDWKCGKELCHNSPFSLAPMMDVDRMAIVQRYMKNNITQALVFSGLEPLDDFKDVFFMIETFRLHSNDDIVIYTGYNKEEIEEQVKTLQDYFKNIIIKYGRYIPNQISHLDSVLGISLASDNQYAEKIC